MPVPRFAPAGGHGPCGPGVGKPVAPSGPAVETMGSLRFLGNPRALMPCSSTPAGTTCQVATARRRGPRLRDNEGSNESFSFEARSQGLGARCLRFAAGIAPEPRKTRFRLPAKLCRVGLVTHRIPPKGFGDASYIASSFPKLSLTQLPSHHVRRQSLRRLAVSGRAATW